MRGGVARGSERTRGGAHTNKAEHTHTNAQHAHKTPQSNSEPNPPATPRTHRHARAREQQAERAPPPPRDLIVVAWQGASRAPGCKRVPWAFKAPATGPLGGTGHSGSHQKGGGAERGRKGKKDAGEERASAERAEDHLGIPSLQYTTILLPGMPNHLRAVFRRKKQTPRPHERSGFIRWSPPVLKSKGHKLATRGWVPLPLA